MTQVVSANTCLGEDYLSYNISKPLSIQGNLFLKILLDELMNTDCK